MTTTTASQRKLRLTPDSSPVKSRKTAALVGATVVRALVTAVLVCWIALVFVARWSGYAARDLAGTDFLLMRELGRRWVEDGSIYAPWQLAPFAFDAGAGGQDVSAMPGLYPPIAGPLFAVLTASPVIWWGVPLAIMGWALWRLRPRGWTVVLMLLLLAPPLVLDPFVTGNPTIWFAAATAAGAVLGWPAVLVVIKPTLAPFVLFGLAVSWRRSLVALAVLAAISVAMLPELLRYVQVLGFMEGAGLTYSLWAYPLLGVWVVAWFAARWRATEELSLDGDRLVVGAEPLDGEVVEGRIVRGPEPERSMTP